MRHLVHFIHRDGAGGGPKVIRQLISGLPEFRHTLVHGDRGDLHAWCVERGVEAVEVESPSVGGSLATVPMIAGAFRKASPDAILLHGQWAGPVGALAARRAGIRPSIYIAHCPAFYHSTTLWKALRNYVAEKIPCSLAEAVVTLSLGNHYGYLYRGWAGEEKLVRIPNGLDPADVPDSASVERLRVEHEWDPAKVHVVFAGRLDDQKRVDWLLDAWASEPRLVARAMLWIVGDGREQDHLATKAFALPVRESVRFVGAQPSAMEWIAASDVVVLSSLYEGHALVPLEAMACSKPVAAFATHGVVDSIADGETGLLAPLGDTHALGSALLRLVLDRDLRLRMGRAGRERLTSSFPLSRTLAAYRDLLQKLWGTGGPSNSAATT